MKWALLSDIHANLHALEACLAHADTQGVQRWAVLGDLVGYGAQPAQVVARLQALHRQGAVVLQGNHDHPPQTNTPAAPTMAQATTTWTWAQLGEEARSFLIGLPLAAPVGAAWAVHASADAPERWTYVDSEPKAARCLAAAQTQGGAHGVFVGHVHHQRLFYPGANQHMMVFSPTAGVALPLASRRGFVATVGSVGQPRDGDTRAMYAVYDAGASTLTFHRVAYDHLSAADAVRQAGLPEVFAARLEVGR